jgi:hypothetical protein
MRPTRLFDYPAGHRFAILSCGAGAFGVHHESRLVLQALFISAKVPPAATTNAIATRIPSFMIASASRRRNSRASDSPCVSHRLDRSQRITTIDAVVQGEAPNKSTHWRLAPTFDTLSIGSAAISKNALRQIHGNQNIIGIAGLISPHV